MCLLFQKPANVTFDDEHLRDFYSRNQDGFGVMYVEDNKLYMDKEIGSVENWIAFFRKHEHRDACFHLRMRTHGATDLENCHPYPVFGFEGGDPVAMPMLMMHNGVLSTGNTKDLTKSDTWHYVRDYLRPLLAKNPGLIKERAFTEIIGKHIGSNRFAIMDAHGNTAIINRDQGVEYNGAWLSNTYAWSASKYMPKPVYSYTSYSGSSSIYTGGSWHNGKRGYWSGGKFYSFDDRDWDGDFADPKTPGVATTPSQKTSSRRGGKKKGGPGLSKEAAKTLKKGTIVQRGDVAWEADGKGGWKVAGFGKTSGLGRIGKQVPLALEVAKTTAPQLVPDQYVDDVLEIHSILGVAYPECATRDSQIVQMLDIMGTERLYSALSLVLHKHQSPRWWDNLAGSVLEMREFMRHNLTEYMPAVNADHDVSDDEKATVLQ